MPYPSSSSDGDGDELERARVEIARLTAENARLRELLDMAQDFGRLGVWERDPRTLEGHWDEHVFRFFGFEPGHTPSFREAATRVHPEDSLHDAFLASLETPGSYAGRFRIMRPDGTVAHMHSQWRVVADVTGRAARVIGVMMDDTDARTAAQQVELEHAQLQLALELSHIGLWRYDLSTQRMHHDAQSLAFLGRPARPEGRPIEEVRSWVHPDDLKEVREAFERTVAEGGPIDTQTRYLHVDGRWRTVLTRRVLQRDDAGKPLAIVGVGMDITDQRERTQQALQLAQRLDAAAEAARVGLWSGPLDGRPPEWNAYMYTLLGRDPALGPLSMGESLREYTHPDDRDRVATQVLSWMRGKEGAQLDIEMRIRRGDGVVRWMEVRSRQEVDADGVHRAFGVMLDVTEQREVLLALREANERARLALSSVGMGTWVHDALSGRDDWDEQMFRLRGLEPSARVPGREERMALVIPEDRSVADTKGMPFLSSAAPLSYEFRIARANDGAVRTIASRSIALTDAQGHVIRRIGVNWDVTDARSVERAQRERELALRESRTQAALFARISHELRTPLNAVLGFTQLLLAGDEKASAAHRRERLTQIQAAGDALLSAVNGVLELSEQAEAVQPLARDSVALDPLVDRALAGLAPQIAARGIEVRRGVLAARAVGDARRVQQVLSQLLSNAVKFSRRGGRVQIDARVEGREARVAVTDQGAGISAERAQRLFEPPWGESARAGSEQGIGLVIAQASAQRMGGRIELVRSNSDGSVFELSLPLAEMGHAPSPSNGELPRVLYIEDNEVNMLIVRELLARRPRLAFHGAVDGLSGVRLARELRPSVVLVDMQLPDIDGLEVLRRLRADPLTATATCVALSANAMPEDMRRARAAGFDDYWTKPIDLTAFLAAIDKLLPTPSVA